MKTRVISGIILGIILALLIIIGRAPLLIASLFVGLQGCFELYKVSDIHKKPLSYVAYFLIIAFYHLVYKGYMNERGTVICIFLLVLILTLAYLFIHVLMFPKFVIKNDIIYILGILYPGIMSSCLYLCRIKSDGLFYSALIILASLCTDIFAYFVGINFGKHHPFPELSPKKSLEGCIGGILGTSIISVIISLIFKKNIATILLVSIISAIFSMFGDLSASSIKREHNIKDYSFIIPGHGGIMDRFDSTLFVGAIVFICVTLLF